MLRPLPNLDDASAMAELGKRYSLQERWLEAVKVLRDSVGEIQSPHESSQINGIKNATEAAARLAEIKALQG